MFTLTQLYDLELIFLFNLSYFLTLTKWLSRIQLGGTYVEEVVGSNSFKIKGSEGGINVTTRRKIRYYAQGDAS